MKFTDSLTYGYLSNTQSTKSQSKTTFIDYIRLLADVGHLDRVKQELSVIFEASSVFDKQISDDTLIRMHRLLHRLPKPMQIFEIQSLDELCGFVLYHKEWNILLEHLFLEKIFFNIDLEQCTHTENMMISFLILRIIEADRLSVDFAIRFIKFYCFCKRRNNVRSDFMVIIITEYALKKNWIQFFKMGKRYNHLQNILARIYNSLYFLDDHQKRQLSQRILSQVYVQNDLRTPLPKKLAICISGIYRGHETALLSIRALAQQLNADIYMHTWDQTAQWPGIGGTPSFARLFGAENEAKITAEFRGLNNILKIEHLFPKVYQVLKNPIYVKTDLARLKQCLGDTAAVCIENQEQVIHTLIENGHDFEGRGGLNQFKMFFGIMKSFEMAVESGIEYDYILRIRPDVFIDKNYITLDELQKNTFYGLVERVVGFTDLEFLISSDMAISFSRMIREMLQLKRLSPFTYLPKYDSHLLIFAWIVHNKYEVARDLLDRKLMDSSQFNQFPSIEKFLKNDIKELTEAQLEQYHEFIEFLMIHCNIATLSAK